jgi:ABC-2 type transport system ATP-binding protein
MADRVGIMHQGRLVAVGTPDELRGLARAGAGGTLEQVFLTLTSTATGDQEPSRAHSNSI